MSVNNQPLLSQISVYPIKSVKGINLSSSWVEFQGLAFDRRFMVALPDGAMVTARKFPQMVRVSVNLRFDGLVISYGDKEPLVLKYNEFSMNEAPATVWKDTFAAYQTTESANIWFSEIIGQPVELLFTGAESNRQREKLGHNVSFADGYPLLVISQASLDELNRRSPEVHTMAQFRPNITVSGDEPFIEDSWKRIRIGEVEFEVRKPCERCILTTVDSEKGEFRESKEPLKTLAGFRANEKGGTFFGQNLVALNEGTIEVGDTIEILESKQKEQYPDKELEKLDLTCVAVEEVARDFTTYWLEPVHGVLPTYQPGQYLPIEIEVEGQKLARHYTLSSSPSRPGRYAVSVKRVNGGQVSNWILDNLRVGDVLSADSPQGGFHLDRNSNHPLLLLSAGSGVTPMLSMLRYLADHNQMKDVVFYHQCSTLDDIPYRNELDELNRRYDGLHVIISLTQADDEWEGVKGRLALLHLKLISNLETRQTFVCGPSGFMRKAKNLLLKAGLPDNNYHQEQFSVETEKDRAKAALTISINGTLINGDNQSTLLQQAEDAGLPIANSCRAGFCGACMMTLESGEVDQPDVPALTDNDWKNNKILACCSVPKTDIEVISD